MATSRQERMQERMRGAQRHQVQDTSFGLFLDLPEPETAAIPASPNPVPRSTPNTSAKRRRLDERGSALKVPHSQSQAQAQPQGQTQDQAQPEAQLQAAGVPPSTRRRLRGDPYSLTDQSSADENAITRRSIRKTSPNGWQHSSTNARGTTPGAADDGPERAVPATSTPRSVVAMEDIVTESPADAPGSGQRRRVRISGIPSSSVLLQEAMADEERTDNIAQSSSPLLRKGRTGGRLSSSGPAPSGVRRSTRLSNEQTEEEGLSPSRSARQPQGTRRVTVEKTANELEDDVNEDEQEAHSSEIANTDEAEEIGDAETARRLGRKRLRKSFPAPSPELDSSMDTEEPTVSRPRQTVKKKKSPAKQKQPRAPSTKSKASTKDKGDEVKKGGVQIGIHRFPQPKDSEAEDPDADELLCEIPFANRSGVNAVDVFSQLFEEVVEATKENLRETAREANDSATKREIRTKITALDAFREELRTQFLEQTIVLDTLHALRKRVRQAQKDKLALRSEIIRIRAERDQVALRMDAVRIEHEEQSKVALHHINLSSAMHDIDLAVERGRAAPKLSVAKQKEADLANLEFVIAKISEEACSTAGGGGTLNQIKSFNAFLQRAAAVLESR